MTKQEQRKQLWTYLEKFRSQGFKVNVNGRASFDKMQAEYDRIQQRLIQLASALQKHHKNRFNTVVIPSTKYNSGQSNKTLADKISDSIEQIPIGAMITIDNHTFQNNNKWDTINIIIDILPYDLDEQADQILKTLYWTTNSVQSKKYRQAYRFSDSINCFIIPIKNLIQQRIDTALTKSTQRVYQATMNKIVSMISKFEQDGATEQLIQELMDQTKGSVKIYNPLDSRQYIKFKSQNTQMAQYKLNYINSRFDHVDLWTSSSTKIQQLEVISDYVEDGLSKIQIMNEIAYSMQISKEAFIFKRGQDGFIKLQQGLNVFIRDDYHKLQLSMQDMKNELKDLNLRLNTNQSELLNQFLNMSNNIRFKQNFDRSQLQHIDIIKGYTVGERLSQYYKGFSYISQLRFCNNEIALKYNGLYIVDLDIEQCPQYIKVVLKQQFRKHYYLSHPILVFLNDNGVQFNVIAGFYGIDSKMLQYKQDWITKHYDGKGAYYMVPSLGMRNQNLDIEQMCYIDDKKIAELTTKDNELMFYKTNKQNEYIIKRVVEEKPYQITLKAYSAQVLQYQQLAVMIQLKQMNMDKVVSLIGDDIYYLKHDFQIMSYMNTEKDNSKFDKICWQNSEYSFLNNTYWMEEQNIDLSKVCGQPRDLYKTELHLGPGGNGKSYSLLTDIGNVNIYYTTLTNDLSKQQCEKYQVKGSTCDMLVARKSEMKYYPTNIVIDEIGLVGYGKIRQIKELFPNTNIYCLGDDLQLVSLPHPQLFDYTEYDKVYDEQYYTTDYRAQDPYLRMLKRQIRQAMREGKSETELFNNYLQMAQRINKDYIDGIYDSNTDIVVTANNNNKDRYTELLKDKKPKYRVIKTFTKDGITYCAGQILKDIPFEHRNFQIQHAFTCHSLQGLTHTGKLFITRPPNSEDPSIIQLFRGYVYTAVSRCVELNQIYIVE